MKNTVAISLPILASIFLLANVIIQNSAGNLTEQLSVLSPSPPHLVPRALGGFDVKGACDLKGIKEQNETVELGMFVKHGLHTTRGNFFPKDCTAVERNVITKKSSNASNVFYPQLSVNDFIQSPKEHKILAARNPASFYKSVFNHICNKRAKREWRQENNVDCRNEGEFAKLLKLDQQEIAKRHDPFGLKETIMKSEKVKRIMLVDYTCIPKVITSLCGEPMVSYDSIVGNTQSNSAVSQSYTDFWSMHNYTPPFSVFNQFWDDMYGILAEVCCVELVKTN